jgi:hypothetical protein
MKDFAAVRESIGEYRRNVDRISGAASMTHNSAIAFRVALHFRFGENGVFHRIHHADLAR